MFCIREIVRKRRLKRDLLPDNGKKYPSKRGVKMLVFFYNAQSIQDIEQLNLSCKCLQDNGLQYLGVVYAPKCKIRKAIQVDFMYRAIVLRRGQLNWLGIPKKNTLSALEKEKFDLMLNYNAKSSFTTKYLAATIPASFMAAMKEEEPVRYDMIIKGAEGAPLGNLEFTEQIALFLKELETAN